MSTFTGTTGDDLITPGLVSPGVTSDDGSIAPTVAFSDDIDGGAGNDTIDGGGAIGDRDFIGGDEGNDLLISADGTLAFGGVGDDTLVGATNDVLFGEEGNDLLIAGDSTRGFGGDGDDHFIIPTDVNGAELHGEDGNDTFEATAGNDEIHGDAGDDVVNWSMTGPQTSNSLIDGGEGFDTFKVTATQDGQPATIELSNDGEGFEDIHVVRDLDTWAESTDANLFTQDVEHIAIVAGRGADNIVIQDQTGLGVQQIDIDLGASATGGPDGQGDAATLEATDDADHVAITTTAGAITASGLGANVKVSDIDHSAAVTDQVTVATGFGDDQIDLTRGADGAQLTALTIDGGDGADTVAVTGTTAGEAFVIGANGDHATLSQGGVSLGQLVNVETLDVQTRGGGDSVLVNALEGTAITNVNLDLSGATPGVADGVHDRVTFEDLAAGDGIFVTQGADGHSVQVSEGTTGINVASLDNQDQVIVHGNAGDDVIVASGVANVSQITLNGGDGDDLVIGGNGAENLFGEAGSDTLEGGAGRNVLNGGDGDDAMSWSMGTDISSNSLLDGGAGHDSLAISGPQDAKSWTITVGPNGTGFDLFQLDHAGLTAKLFSQTTEDVSITAGNGADSVTVGDQTGLGVQTLRLFTEAGDDRIDLTGERTFGGVVIVDTGAGNDTVTGGAASDTFVFHAGDHSADVFNGFQSGDHIDLRDAADHSFAELVANGHIVQSGADVLILDGAGTTLTLANVDVANLSATDFLFA
jgi:Ca2+-binding RTX toxin-like protein